MSEPLLSSGPINLLAATRAAVILNGPEALPCPSRSCSRRRRCDASARSFRFHTASRGSITTALSGIIFVIKGGLRWRDAPPGYGPHKTLYNRFVRWSRMGVFSRIFAALAGEAGEPDRLTIDSTHLKALRTAAVAGRPRLIAHVQASMPCGQAGPQFAYRLAAGVDLTHVAHLTRSAGLGHGNGVFRFAASMPTKTGLCSTMARDLCAKDRPARAGNPRSPAHRRTSHPAHGGHPV